MRKSVLFLAGAAATLCMAGTSFAADTIKVGGHGVPDDDWIFHCHMVP